MAGNALFVAHHPDGKRTAIDDDGIVHIFDRTTKKQTSTFKAFLSNGLMGMWFVGDLVLVSGTDAGPYAEVAAFSLHGHKRYQYEGFYEGALGIGSNGHAIIQETAGDTFTIVDNKTGRGKAITRHVPKPPKDCTAHTPGLDPESTDPVVQACVAYHKNNYDPFSSVVFVDDGPDFIGVMDGSLVTLDGKTFAEKARVKLPMCPKKPDPPAP
jgi:hypothetical protein